MANRLGYGSYIDMKWSNAWCTLLSDLPHASAMVRDPSEVVEKEWGEEKEKLVSLVQLS